ncbi:MAG: 50S ribosomal protein L3 N(5)-glutamine methyltransferase [Pseudohongiellaceae bacterium]|nr:50S ribosomal protein L3 N(5)-glutamine methyltransferase [Pseudohongiellaceae bacterium]
MTQFEGLTLLECIQDLSARFEDAELFYGHGTDNAWDEAIYLSFSLLKVSFDVDDSVGQRILTREELEQINALAKRRIEEHVPVAYLVEEAWFAGLSFKVDKRVLVPRSPLGEMIQNRFEPLLTIAPKRILDLCTGSGCIGIATAIAFPEAKVELADISVDALALAAENIERHQLAERVQAIESDLFEKLNPRYELIVSNPPYVSADEIAQLPPEYRHEPELGLFSEEEGLAIPIQILREAEHYLSDGGILLMEVGYSWEALAARLPGVPFLWLEFESGGEGVCALTKQQLIDSRELLAN